MTKKPDFDLAAAHKYFAAACFNNAWTLIEKPDRTPAEDRMMVALSQASLFHWMNRPDCTDRNLSVGYWQASRIQALLKNAAEARRYAEISRDFSAALAPFYVGYAYEALARAAALTGDAARTDEYLDAAEAHAALVTDTDDRRLLEKDLEELRNNR